MAWIQDTKLGKCLEGAPGVGMNDKPLLDWEIPHSAQGGPTPPFSPSPAQPRGPRAPSEIPKTGRPLSQAVLGQVPGC